MNQALVAILKMSKKHLKSPFPFQYLTNQNDVSKHETICSNMGWHLSISLQNFWVHQTM
jgi:hypothetical protein